MANIVVNPNSDKTQTGTEAADTVTLNGNGTGFTFDLLGGADSVSGAGDATYENSTFTLGDGADVVSSGIGSNSIVYGNLGTDNLTFGADADNLSIYGGQDGDTISVSGENALIYGNLGADIIRAGAGSGLPGDPGVGAEASIYGGQGDDVITGSGGGGDYIDGGADRDQISGGVGGESTLVGGVDDDFVAGLGEGDVIYGNTGSDTLDASGESSSVYGGQGEDAIGVTGDSSIVYGNLGDDVINLDATSGFTVGTSSFSTVYGGQGDDAIRATSPIEDAQNTIYGNLGNDMLTVGDDASTVFGGQGDDVITGNNADAVLSGNLGNDTFVTTGATVSDDDTSVTITDFVTGSDKVNAGGAAAVGGAGGNYIESQDADIDSAAAAAGSVAGPNNSYTFVAGQTDGYLVYTNGSGVETTTTLDGLNSLEDFAASDIQGNAQANPS